MEAKLKGMERPIDRVVADGGNTVKGNLICISFVRIERQAAPENVSSTTRGARSGLPGSAEVAQFSLSDIDEPRSRGRLNRAAIVGIFHPPCSASERFPW